MNFLQQQNQVAYWLDDLQFGYFTPVQVKLWLNNAQIELQKLLLAANENYYVKCIQTSTVVGQQDYVLPDDFHTLHRLELVVSGVSPNETVTPIAPITSNQRDLVPSGVGQPGWYFIKRNRLVMMPAPDTIKTLRMDYSYRVADMVLDTDVPDAPPHYHEFMAVLATIDGLLKDGRDVGPMLEKRRYYELMLKSDADERNQDAPRSIVTTGEGFGVGSGYY